MQERWIPKILRSGFFDWPDIPACAGCKYYRPIYDHGHGRRPGNVCHYLLDVGESRRCDPGAGCVRRVSRGGDAL